MRILVFPRDLELGGSSINAIDLAAAVRKYGHETVIISNPGPLEERLVALDLPYELTELPTSPRPAPKVIRALRRAVRRHGIDLIHTYEYWPCVEAFYSQLVGGRPVLGTILSMKIPEYLPESVPITAGTRDLVDAASAARAAPAYLIEPPIDTSLDHPGIETAEFVDGHGLPRGEVTVAIVSRIARNMKQESIERAIDAVARLAASRPIHLLVVGDGSAMGEIRERANRRNAAAGRRVIVVTGAMPDPRPAYAAADIVLGMGSSILRGMAIGKPAIVVGEQGFTMPVTPATMDVFVRTGFYGIGAGRPDPDDDPLPELIAALADDPNQRQTLGDFGSSLVQERYSLDAAAARLDEIYADVAASPPRLARRVADATATAVRIVRHKASDRGLLAQPRVRRPDGQNSR